MSEVGDETWDDVQLDTPLPPSYPAPQRMADGLITSALRRPLWSLAGASLTHDQVNHLKRLAEGQGKHCVVVDPTSRHQLRNIRDVLRLTQRPSPADVLHIGSHWHDDAVPALALGVQPLLIGPEVTARHVLTVRCADELIDLVTGIRPVESFCTYHEV